MLSITNLQYNVDDDIAVVLHETVEQLRYPRHPENGRHAHLVLLERVHQAGLVVVVAEQPQHLGEVLARLGLVLVATRVQEARHRVHAEVDLARVLGEHLLQIVAVQGPRLRGGVVQLNGGRECSVRVFGVTCGELKKAKCLGFIIMIFFDISGSF